MTRPVGVYEKALPEQLSWPARFALATDSGYDFLELAVDESAERVARLDWSASERQEVRDAAAATGVTVGTVTLSAHRATPLGSADRGTRELARELSTKAIDLAADLGADCVQMAGYFTYHEPRHPDARDLFLDGLLTAADHAMSAGITLGLENVDGNDVTTIDEAIDVVTTVGSPALKLYIDVGNLAGNGRDVPAEVRRGLPYAHAVQLKDARPGVFRRVAFGQGTVPWPEVMRVLDDAWYTGPISIEMWNDDQDVDLASAAARWFAQLSGRSIGAGS